MYIHVSVNNKGNITILHVHVLKSVNLHHPIPLYNTVLYMYMYSNTLSVQ